MTAAAVRVASAAPGDQGERAVRTRGLTKRFGSVVALIDLERDERRVRGGRKVVWALIIVFVNIIGPIVYFTVGREEA